jgi:hypothetical protein
LLRFHERLSFLLKELIEDGVGGSSGLERGMGDLGADFCALGARGPEGFWCTIDSVVLSEEAGNSPLVWDLLRYAGSMS